MDNTSKNETASAPKTLDNVADEVMANDTDKIVTVDQIIIDLVAGIQQLGVRAMLALKIIERINRRDANQSNEEIKNEPADT